MHRPYYKSSRKEISDIEKYQQHLRILKEITTNIDNAAPALPGNTYIKTGILEADSRRLAEIETENRTLIRKLNIIGRLHGKVDCFQTFTLKQTNFYDRIRSNKEIEEKNKVFYSQLESVESKFKKDDLMDQYEAHRKQLIETSDYPEFYFIKKLTEQWTIAPEGYDQSLLNPHKRTRCYFDLAQKNIKIGRLVMEIWMDVAPVAGCNFVNLCKGYSGFSYKNTPLFKIFSDVFCLGGDVINKVGTGIYSAYGGINSTYVDENTILEFNGPGVIAAHTVFAGDNHSQFLITFRKMPTLNKQFVVFGRVVTGLSVLEVVEGFGTKGGEPLQEILITDCGIIKGRVPNPKIINVPERVSPESSEEKLTYKNYNRIQAHNKTTPIRTQIIKQSRKELEQAGWPRHKLRMKDYEKFNISECNLLAGIESKPASEVNDDYKNSLMPYELFVALQ